MVAVHAACISAIGLKRMQTPNGELPIWLGWAGINPKYSSVAHLLAFEFRT
jgi:hypothetical protein